MIKERQFKTGAARCAYEIKQDLKKAFPHIKFSVSSDTFSMGDSVRISWQDGPTTDEVKKITGKRQEGHFDGMTDMYEYSNSRDDIAQAKYVQTSRQKSEKVKALLPQLQQWSDQPDQTLHRLFCKTSFPPGSEVVGIERTDASGGAYHEDFFKIVFNDNKSTE